MPIRYRDRSCAARRGRERRRAPSLRATWRRTHQREALLAVCGVQGASDGLFPLRGSGPALRVQQSVGRRQVHDFLKAASIVMGEEPFFRARAAHGPAPEDDKVWLHAILRLEPAADVSLRLLPIRIKGPRQNPQLVERGVL